MKVDQLPINQKVKIIFKHHDERFPMIGKFVNIHDAKELSSKGMVRFVNQTKLDFWSDENPQVGLTRIFVATDITQAIPV